MRRRAEINDDVNDTGQDVHVLMAVGVRRADARRRDAAQLCRELRAHLIHAHHAAQHAHGQRCVIGEESALLCDEGRDLCGRQDGRSIDEREVDADPERGCSHGELRRICKCRAACHDRCRAQHALLHGCFDGTIDEHVSPEVVRIDDNLFQVCYPCA